MRNKKVSVLSKAAKRIMALMLAVLIALSGSLQYNLAEVQAASAETRAKSAYATFLSKKIKWTGSEYRNPSELKFGLIDIDNDKVPELYVYTKKWSYTCPYKLYGYVSGKVKCLYSINHKNYKLVRAYPAKRIFTVGGDGLKYGSSARTILELKNGKVYERASWLKSGLTGKTTYYDSKRNVISRSLYDKIFKKYIGSASAKKSPSMYDNTASNRDTKLKGKKPTQSPVKFKKTNLWAFSNGGFYLKIYSISGRKMKVSIHMPENDKSGIVATIDSTGKKATAQYTCGYGEKHSLKFWISGSGIKVKETTKCWDKLLGWTDDAIYQSSITHGFYPQSHFHYE